MDGMCLLFVEYRYFSRNSPENIQISSYNELMVSLSLCWLIFCVCFYCLSSLFSHRRRQHHRAIQIVATLNSDHYRFYIHYFILSQLTSASSLGGW